MPDENEPNTPNNPPPSATPLFAANEKIAKINVAEEIKNSLPRLLDVGDHLARAARRARRAEAVAAPHSLRDERPRRDAEPQAPQVRQDRRRNDGQLPSARRPGDLSRRSSTWPSRGRCASDWWTGRGTSARSKATRRRPCGTPRRGWRTSARCSWRTWTRTRWISSRTTTKPAPSRRSFPPRSRTCSSTAAPASPSAWPPTCRRTTSAKSLTASARRLTTRTSRSPELMKHIKGPDFPTGCMVCGLEGIKQYFTTGRGSLKVRGKVGVEQLKGGTRADRHHGNPLQREPRRCWSSASPSWSTRRSSPTSPPIRDESDENTRVVIELKRDAIAEGRHQQPLQAHRAGNAALR